MLTQAPAPFTGSTYGPQVSLIIPVRDEAATIPRLIESINQQSRKPDEVIFVDGGSRDGSIELLRAACSLNPGFRLIAARRALPGQGRNIGVANANYDWIAFTDAGNQLNADWLEQLIAAAESDPAAGIVCGNYEPVTDTFFTDCAAVAYIDNKVSRETGLCRGPFIASSLVRRSVWHAAGGFPELRAAEDLIFFEDVEKKGYRFRYAPKATVHFQLRPGLWSTFRRFLLYSTVNVWAGRQHKWHYGIVRWYLLALPFVILAIWKSAWWLLIPAAGLCLRVANRIWSRREGRRIFWALNPLRFGYVLIITLAVDLATFCGWIVAILKRGDATKIRNHLRTRRGD